MSSVQPAGGLDEPIRGGNVSAQVKALRKLYPRLYECLDVSLVESVAPTENTRDDFGPDYSGGRGDHYIHAQTTNLLARAGGIKQLLSFFRSSDAIKDHIVLDLLGGDGHLRKVATHLHISGLEILTCDASNHMIESAWASGVPAILQRANQLLCRSCSVDGVLLAYGTHHIEPEERPLAFKEAHRVLRLGGKLVVHDFEVGSATNEWFETVVNPFSETGHRFKHFTKGELATYMEMAGFSNPHIFNMTDSYRVVAESPEAVELRMGKYLVDMYGLVKVERSLGADGAARWVMGKAREIFGRIMPIIGPIFDTVDHVWCIEVPRIAIVAVGMRTQP